MNKNNKINHYINGDDMKEILWQLFRETGKIEYYLEYKKKTKVNNMIEVEGIVLNTISYGETSKIINVFTKDGIIGMIAKGAKTLKSSLRSTTDKLTYGIFKSIINKTNFQLWLALI